MLTRLALQTSSVIVLVASLPLLAGENSPSIDLLLAAGGRDAHAALLESERFGGRTYPWDAYSTWGRELFHTGQVATPPLGGAPSRRLSRYKEYTCSACHNITREDYNLTRQDSDNRFALIEVSSTPLRMVQGTTLWAVVNRRTFYNGHYSKYNGLPIPVDSHPSPETITCNAGEDCRPWRNDSLADAIQVCGFYCSEGEGFLAKWELLSLLTFMWDIELRLADVDSANETKDRVAKVLLHRSAYSAEIVRIHEQILNLAYLSAAGATKREIPPAFQKSRFHKPGKKARTALQADANTGERLYALACVGCHFDGSEVSDSWGVDLGLSESYFHQVLADGKHATSRRPYMPEFTNERLSPVQATLILAYLQSLDGAER